MCVSLARVEVIIVNIARLDLLSTDYIIAESQEEHRSMLLVLEAYLTDKAALDSICRSIQLYEFVPKYPIHYDTVPVGWYHLIHPLIHETVGM